MQNEFTIKPGSELTLSLPKGKVFDVDGFAGKSIYMTHMGKGVWFFQNRGQEDATVKIVDYTPGN